MKYIALESCRDALKYFNKPLKLNMRVVAFVKSLHPRSKWAGEHSIGDIVNFQVALEQCHLFTGTLASATGGKRRKRC